MANLRRNYQKQGKGLQTTYRLVVFLIIAIICLVGGFIWLKDSFGVPPSSAEYESKAKDIVTFLPSAHGQVVDHKYYSISYIEDFEQAEWSAYKMDRAMLNAPNVPRERFFAPDPLVITKSAVHSDYTNSGYTRGHLTPAGDMAFDTSAMRESFFMSNMSPQIRSFNNGIWKELEENIRDWTYKCNSLYIVTGPLFDSSNPQKIGKNKVAIPSAFFKILMDYGNGHNKAIAFIIPHELSEKRLETYAVSIDEVEKITDLDFFNDMISDVEEEKLESATDMNQWKVSDARYQLRVNRWNKE